MAELLLQGRKERVNKNVAFLVRNCRWAGQVLMGTRPVELGLHAEAAGTPTKLTWALATSHSEHVDKPAREAGGTGSSFIQKRGDQRRAERLLGTG